MAPAEQRQPPTSLSTTRYNNSVLDNVSSEPPFTFGGQVSVVKSREGVIL